GIATEHATLPWGAWATTLLKLALVCPLDKVYRLHGTAMPMVAVNMLRQRVGGRDLVYLGLVQATRDLQRVLEEYDLTIHSGKTRVLSNGRDARSVIAASCSDGLARRRSGMSVTSELTALMVVALTGRTAGKSRALTLMCHGKVDPLYRATLLPFVMFVR
ncbi:unnamed protein product, partial [Prorocentrum cordatum]